MVIADGTLGKETWEQAESALQQRAVIKAIEKSGTLTGIKALCVLVPGIFLVGSWIAFRFVWNITPEIRAKMAASKAAKSAQ